MTGVNEGREINGRVTADDDTIVKIVFVDRISAQESHTARVW